MFKLKLESFIAQDIDIDIMILFQILQSAALHA